jgi:HAD superfamily hydrolase (TIGR01509 family)
MSFKYLIFDLGNVIITNDWFDKYSKVFKIPNKLAWKVYTTYWTRLKEGSITEEEFWKLFLIDAKLKITLKKAKELWREEQKPIENMFELLKKLKKNYKLVALTNIGDGWLEFKREKYGLDKYFKKIFASCEMHAYKPNPEVYKNVLKDLKVMGEECIFIDDKQRGLSPARKLRIHAIQFKGQKGLEKELRELGIKF